MTSKSPLSKCLLLGGVAASALICAQLPVEAQTYTTSTTTTVVSGEPLLVTGTVENYWVDRAGFVTAMSVRTADGVQIVRFSPTQAHRLSDTYAIGTPVNVWVSPVGTSRSNVWYARGIGPDRPTVWWSPNVTSDYDWLRAEPYYNVGYRQATVSGTLRGIVMDDRGEILALDINTANGPALIRVPREIRHIAPGHIGGTERVASLFRGAHISATGVPEAHRLGVLSTFGWRLAANTIEVNGRNAGAISIQAMPQESRRALLGWDVSALGGNSPIEVQADQLGYRTYRSGEVMAHPTYVYPASSAYPGTTTSTYRTTTDTATGRVMIVTADGQMLPVVRQDNRVWVQRADGTRDELLLVDGRYVVPAHMTGSRMMMVMADGRRMEMDTVNGQLVVILADGTRAPVTLHSP